jgi:integrase
MTPRREPPLIVNGEKRGRPGRWLVCWYDAAGKQRLRPWYSREAAEDERDRIHAERKQLLADGPGGDAAITLAQAFKLYFEAMARKKSVAQERHSAAHLMAALGPETQLRALGATKIAKYRSQRLNAKSVRRKDAEGQPTPLSAASINRPLALLRHLLRLAHEEWRVIGTVPHIRLEKEPQGRLRWLEDDEAVRLLAACKASSHPALFALVTVALESGLRKGELLGLTWDRVNVSRGVLRLEVTKSDKRREVPMRQKVYDILSALPKPHDGRVFPTSSIRTAFETAVKQAKLNAPFRFHDLRHTFASWFVMRGGSLQALSEILGHADLKMTLRYAHLSPGHLRAEMLKTANDPQGPEKISSSDSNSDRSSSNRRVDQVKVPD